MTLEKLLAERRRTTVKKWFDHVVDTYPADTSKFLKQQKDPFANPVGSTTLKSLTDLFDQLTQTEMDMDAVNAALDPVIRIRAVQTSFSPSQAVGFPYFLKDILREEFASEMTASKFQTEFMDLERRIDRLTLMAFNIYMKCREAVINLKINAEKERIYHAFSRAGLVKEIPDPASDLESE